MGQGIPHGRGRLEGKQERGSGVGRQGTKRKKPQPGGAGANWGCGDGGGQKSKGLDPVKGEAFENNPGSDLLSHTVTHAVPSAEEGLTTVFGMGTGVTLLL